MLEQARTRLALESAHKLVELLYTHRDMPKNEQELLRNFENYYAQIDGILEQITKTSSARAQTPARQSKSAKDEGPMQVTVTKTKPTNQDPDF